MSHPGRGKRQQVKKLEKSEEDEISHMSKDENYSKNALLLALLFSFQTELSWWKRKYGNFSMSIFHTCSVCS